MAYRPSARLTLSDGSGCRFLGASFSKNSRRSVTRQASPRRERRVATIRETVLFPEPSMPSTARVKGLRSLLILR